MVPHSLIEESIDLALAEKPDLVCLTGDFVTSGEVYDADNFGPALRRLSNACPTFACNGNHDMDTVDAWIQSLGIEMLVNRSLPVEVGGVRLAITGIGDVWRKLCRPYEAFRDAPPCDFHIALSHNPDSKSRLVDHPWNLLLSGHTHGGQMRLPVLGTPLAPVHDKSMTEGLHEWKGRHVHVSRGVGSLWGIRLNCPPDVSVIDLVPLE